MSARRPDTPPPTLTAAIAQQLEARERGDAPVDTPAAFHYTDAGNAEYFAAHHGQDVRYDHRRGRWLLWRPPRWEPDADAEIQRRAKAAMRARLQEATMIAEAEARERAVKAALASESHSRLAALLALARTERPIADAGTNWDANPWLLATPNGVVDLQAGTLRPGQRRDRVTMSTAVPFDPDAHCPRWEQFIAEVFNGDSALIAFIERAVGYSLTGLTVEQCLFLCYGTGANGKGTFAGTLLHLLSDYGFNMPFSTVEMRDRAAIPNDLAALVGRRFVTASETNDGTRLNESRVKALTGGDPITARFLHSEFFTFTPAAKFWLSVNHKPVVRDDSHGFWRRIRLIPFVRRFEVNPTLADELKAEAPGILAWAVRGCLAWQEHGLSPPDVVVTATRDYETDSDPLAGFLADACDLDPAAAVGASDLFAHYRAWADRHALSERERLTATGFGRKVSERFEKRRDRMTGVVYHGIGRRSDGDLLSSVKGLDQ